MTLSMTQAEMALDALGDTTLGQMTRWLRRGR